MLFDTGVKRKDVFIQTKFSPHSCKDDTNAPCPFDPSAPLPVQVRQSFNSSLLQLGLDYLDSYILHAPFRTHEQTLQVYREMEQLKREVSGFFCIAFLLVVLRVVIGRAKLDF